MCMILECQIDRDTYVFFGVNVFRVATGCDFSMERILRALVLFFAFRLFWLIECEKEFV